MSDTYHLISAACILGPPRHVTMAVGNNGVGVHNVILGTGNDGVGVCDVVTNGKNGCICAYCKFLLEAWSTMAINRATERTSKT